MRGSFGRKAGSGAADGQDEEEESCHGHDQNDLTKEGVDVGFPRERRIPTADAEGESAREREPVHTKEQVGHLGLAYAMSARLLTARHNLHRNAKRQGERHGPPVEPSFDEEDTSEDAQRCHEPVCHGGQLGPNVSHDARQ
jgi:hypothetical protein